MTPTDLRRVVAGAAALAATAAVVARRRLRNPTFDLDGPVGPTDPRPRLRLVWLGDSTAAGKGVSKADETLPRLVAAGLGCPVDVTVLAHPGATVGEVARDHAPRVAELHPDMVFVSAGANDATHLHTTRTVARRYRELLAALPPGPTVVLVGVPDMGAALPRWAQPLRGFSAWRGRRLDAEVLRVAREAGATYVSLAGRTGPTFRRHCDQVYAEDQFHPDELGYRLWAEAVLDALEGKTAAATLACEPEDAEPADHNVIDALEGTGPAHHQRREEP